MPLVRIDVLDNRTDAELAAIGDGVHRALMEAIDVPEHDVFQVRRRHAPNELIFDTEYLGIARTPGIVFIQATISAGRTLEKRKALYQAIVKNLAANPGVRPEDVLINLVETAKENWSFGNGVAQYAT